MSRFWLENNTEETKKINDFLETNKLKIAVSPKRTNIDSFSLKDVAMCIIPGQYGSSDVDLYSFSFEVRTTNEESLLLELSVFMSEVFSETDRIWYRQSNNTEFYFESDGSFQISEIEKNSPFFVELLDILFDISFTDIFDTNNELFDIISGMDERHYNESIADARKIIIGNLPGVKDISYHDEQYINLVFDNDITLRVNKANTIRNIRIHFSNQDKA